MKGGMQNLTASLVRDKMAIAMEELALAHGTAIDDGGAAPSGAAESGADLASSAGKLKGPRKTVTKETFDQAVKENMEEFGMSQEEAVADATLQFKQMVGPTAPFQQESDEAGIANLT